MNNYDYQTISITPSDIEASLDSEVIGLNTAKKTLATIAYKHLYNIKNDIKSVHFSHLLLIGSTGSGKSHLVTRLLKTVDLPSVNIDATTLTESGYRGRDVDSIFEELLDLANGDFEKASRGIVFIDEFDKLKAKIGSERDIGGEGVQQSLLKILDGSNRHLNNSNSRRSRNGRTNNILPTNNLLFIFAGSFMFADEPIDDIVNNIMLLKKYGFLPEILARISLVVNVPSITGDDYGRLINKNINLIIGDYFSIFKELMCDIVITQSAKESLVSWTMARSTGIRGIRAGLEKYLLLALYDLVGMQQAGNYYKVIIDSVNNKLSYKIIKAVILKAGIYI